MKKQNAIKGKMGENLAVEYLLNKNFKIIERNWRYSHYGEIDIIGIDENILVFVEVKSRSTTNFGHPTDAIDIKKINKIKTLANIYLSKNHCSKFDGFRFDAIGVLLKKPPEIIYYKDIYQF